MTWTDARIGELARLWAAGISAGGIAEALGDVSRSAVLGKLHRLRLLRSRKSASAPRRFEGVAEPIAARPLVLKAQGAAPPQPPEPQRSPWCEAAFVPLPGSSPRPWLKREAGECAFPVDSPHGEAVSCCVAVMRASAYCAAHHAIVYRPMSPSARAAEQRRWDRTLERQADQANLERSAA